MTNYSEAVTEYLKVSDSFENMLLAPEVDFEAYKRPPGFKSFSTTD